MTLLLPLLLPLLAAIVVLFCKQRHHATRVALASGVLELVAIGNLVRVIHSASSGEIGGRYLRADGLTSFFLVNIAVVFGLVLIYSTGYLRHIPEGRFSSPRWFYSLLFLSLFTMIAVYLAGNLGLMWIFVEATTLASALLVGFYNTEGAVEAG